MNGDRPILCGVEPVRARYRVDVAVEHEADDVATGIEQGTTRVAADDVAGGRKIHRDLHVEGVAHALPAVRDPERRLTGRARKGRLEARERLYGTALLDPALNGAVVQAQRERGVRIDRRAVKFEARTGDFFFGRADRGFHLVLVTLAQRARLGIDAAGELNEGVIRGGDRGSPAAPKSEPHGRVVEFGLRDQRFGQSIGRVLGQ